MSGAMVALPSFEEMRERLKRTELPPQVTDWLLTEPAPYAGDALLPEGVALRLALIIKLQKRGPDPKIRVATWELVGTIIEALIDDPEAQKHVKEHVAKRNQATGF